MWMMMKQLWLTLAWARVLLGDYLESLQVVLYPIQLIIRRNPGSFYKSRLVCAQPMSYLTLAAEPAIQSSNIIMECQCHS